MSTRLPLSSYGVYDPDAGATEWCRANFYLKFVQHRGRVVGRIGYRIHNCLRQCPPNARRFLEKPTPGVMSLTGDFGQRTSAYPSGSLIARGSFNGTRRYSHGKTDKQRSTTLDRSTVTARSMRITHPKMLTVYLSQN